MCGVVKGFVGAAIRFNEWGRAAMEFQKTSLQSGQGHKYYFSAFFTESELAECKNLKSDIAASFMSAAASI